MILCDEIWRAVVGYEGLYEVSNKGRVRSLDHIVRYHDPRWGRMIEKYIRGRDLRPYYRKEKYAHVQLSKNGVVLPKQIQTLVLTAFVGSRPKGMEACHKNGNRHDNRWPENIRWDTRKNNFADNIVNGTRLYGSKNPMAKLSAEEVMEIKDLAGDGRYTQKTIARLFEMSQSHVSALKTETRRKVEV